MVRRVHIEIWIFRGGDQQRGLPKIQIIVRSRDVVREQRDMQAAVERFHRRGGPKTEETGGKRAYLALAEGPSVERKPVMTDGITTISR